MTMQLTILHDEQDHFSDELSGFSILVEYENCKILFDFSHRKDIFANAEKIGLNLNVDIDYFVLSHGHIDHLENLKYLKLCQRKKLVLHPHALIPKFFENRTIGFDKSLFDGLSQFEVIPSKDVFFISKEIAFLGEIVNAKMEALCTNSFGADWLPDDSGLIINSDSGPVLLTGCSHSGIINMVEKADSIFGEKTTVVIGGLHIFGESDENDRAIKFLRDRGMKVYFGHCFDEFNGRQLESIGGVKFKTLDKFEF